MPPHETDPWHSPTCYTYVLRIATVHVHLSGEYLSFTILHVVFVHMVIKPYYAQIMPNYDSIILLS